MTAVGIFGVDIHPRYQAGISIEQIRREGFDFIAVKVTDGMDSSFMEAGSADMIRRAKKAGLLTLGYHYLRAGNEEVQAKLFGAQLRTLQVPGMLDAEEGAGGITSIRAFMAACRKHNIPVPLMYLPRWYWQKIGSPDLRGLPPLWASRYVTGADFAAKLYDRHSAAGWESYGGLPVEVLQFTDKARVAGRNIDADHYRGTREQFAALIGTEEDVMASLDDVRRVVREELRSPIPREGGVPDSTSIAAVAAWSDARFNGILKRLDDIEKMLKQHSTGAAVETPKP